MHLPLRKRFIPIWKLVERMALANRIGLQAGLSPKMNREACHIRHHPAAHSARHGQQSSPPSRLSSPRSLDPANPSAGAAEPRPSGCSGGWPPPPKYRNTQAANHADYPEADEYPIPDRRGISMSNNSRPVYEQPI